MKIFISIFMVIALALSVVAVPVIVLADNDKKTSQGEKPPVTVGNPLAPGFGEASQDTGIKTKGGMVAYFQTRLGTLLNIMFGALAVFSLIPIVFGGIQLITSQGSSDKVEKGKKALFWGVVGLILAFSAIVIFNFLLRVVLPQ